MSDKNDNSLQGSATSGDSATKQFLNLSALAVVDHEGRMMGVITYDDVIEAMLRPEWRWRGRPAEARPGRQPAGPDRSEPTVPGDS